MVTEITVVKGKQIRALTTDRLIRGYRLIQARLYLFLQLNLKKNLLGLKEALEERKILIDERLKFCIEEKIPPVHDAVHEVKTMAAKLRARAEAVKSEICGTAEECVKRIVSRKQEILARVSG